MTRRLEVQLPVRAAIVENEGLLIGNAPGVVDAFDACAERMIAPGYTAPGEVPGIQVARDLFRALDIDPTRRRPCSEALLNRALKGKPQPRVNTLVDIGNWCALEFLLPLGVYDRDRLDGVIHLRRGQAGETYDAIGGKVLNLAGRYCLADDHGPFGSPITDSLRASISGTTRSSIVIMYAPATYDLSRFEREATTLAERIVEHCGGATVGVAVVDGTERGIA